MSWYAQAREAMSRVLAGFRTVRGYSLNQGEARDIAEEILDSQWWFEEAKRTKADALREAASDFAVIPHPYEGGVTAWLRARANQIVGTDPAAPDHQAEAVEHWATTRGDGWGYFRVEGGPLDGRYVANMPNGDRDPRDWATIDLALLATKPEADHQAEAPSADVERAIFAAVLDECTGRNGGDPHATTWARGGYRNDVPSLCERCERLIVSLKPVADAHAEASRLAQVRLDRLMQLLAARPVVDDAAVDRVVREWHHIPDDLALEDVDTWGLDNAEWLERVRARARRILEVGLGVVFEQTHQSNEQEQER